MNFLKISLILGALALSACGHCRKGQMHDGAKMTPEHHETMAKAHSETAACLKAGKKSKEECGQIMKEAMGAACKHGCKDEKKEETKSK